MKDQSVRVQIWKFIPLNQNKRGKKAVIEKFPKPEGNELLDRKNTDECKKIHTKDRHTSGIFRKISIRLTEIKEITQDELGIRLTPIKWYDSSTGSWMTRNHAFKILMKHDFQTINQE